MSDVWVAPVSALSGIVVGWATSEFSARLGFTRQRREHARLEQLAIAQDVLTAATTAAHEVREAVVLTQYRMRHPSQIALTGVNDAAVGANDARERLRLAVARLRVVGSTEPIIAGALEVRSRVDELFDLSLPISGPLARPVSEIGDVDTARDVVLAEVDGFATVVAATLSA